MNEATAQRIARQLERCRRLAESSPEPAEREQAQRVYERLRRRLEEGFGVADEAEILDPVGCTCIRVAALRDWRVAVAGAAGVLAGVSNTCSSGIRPGWVFFSGHLSGRLGAEHFFEYFERSIDRASKRWLHQRRAQGKRTSRTSVESFRLSAAYALIRRCKAVNPEHRDRRHFDPEDVELGSPLRLDRRTAGSREGWQAGDTIPISQPVEGQTKGPRAIEHQRGARR